jgi:hypothetical protein
MSARLVRMAAVAVGLSAGLAGLAGAASAQEPGVARVEYRYFGQGAYTLVIPARAYDASARREARGADRVAMANVRVLETGQGRYMIPGDVAPGGGATARTADRDDR